MRLLVVDDDAFALQVMRRQLSHCRADDVTCCDSAERALAAIESEAEHFDAIFVDLNMPGMDGVEFLRHLAHRRFRGGLALTTGEDERIVQSVMQLARAHRLQVIGALHKPVSLRQLETVMDALPLQARDTLIPLPARPYTAADVTAGLAGGQFVNYYQPQVDLGTGRVTGVEALSRWQHPRDGLVLPDRFIDVMERHGLSRRLTRVVLDGALRDAAAWAVQGLPPLRIAINVPMDDLVDLDFPDEIVSASAATDVPATRIVIEVTETQLTHHPLELLDIASRLRLKRIGLSIDDFGTGYSSLAKLRDVPFDEIKFDRSFVHGVGNAPALWAILRTNMDMARQLGIRTLAEGIEDAQDWDCLRELGCDLAQGWFVGRPMTADGLAGWLAEWETRRGALVGEPAELMGTG